MQKRRICRENSKYAPDESFLAIFALAERLSTSASLLVTSSRIVVGLLHCDGDRDKEQLLWRRVGTGWRRKWGGVLMESNFCTLVWSSLVWLGKHTKKRINGCFYRTLMTWRLDPTWSRIQLLATKSIILLYICIYFKMHTHALSFVYLYVSKNFLNCPPCSSTSRFWMALQMEPMLT